MEKEKIVVINITRIIAIGSFGSVSNLSQKAAKKAKIDNNASMQLIKTKRKIECIN